MAIRSMTRKEERARLDELLGTVRIFGLNHIEKTRIITALLDGGYRYNPAVLYEASEDIQEDNPESPGVWLRNRARRLEDDL